MFLIRLRLIISRAYTGLMNATIKKEEFLSSILENKGIIIKICNAYCFNKTEREDLTQEIIYQIWKSGNSFNADSKFTTWMYRIALNVAISFYRKQKKITPSIPISGAHLEIEEETTAANEAERKLLLLQKFIAEMKKLDRALTLLYFEEKSYQEIADILGITESNVSTRISRIKQKLKQQFSTIYK